MPGFVSPHHPLIAGGTVTTVTANVAICPITTGFNSGRPLRAISATIVGTAAPGVKTSTITVKDNGNGKITFYLWKPTSNSNPTLIAATDTGTVFTWFAIED